MKLVKKLPLLLLIAAPCFLPIHGRAGDGNDQGQNQDQDQECNPTKPSGTTNSVPLDEGVIFLTVAGLALGARLIYNAKAYNHLKGL
ncbi:MAG: hypothetical protein BGO55_06100 [Sphingobacteriales bacterium 50-39]|nr:hypothetical protein [Sphingobacteriales bacterium]OJW56151.1 MAG: hypothetical protein BGO55_06100 [Sphingobacteriales bacterium 50-39]